MYAKGWGCRYAAAVVFPRETLGPLGNGFYEEK